MAVTINASTSSGLQITSDTSGLVAFQTNGTQYNPLLTAGTAQNSTSGTSIDFTGIPSWAKRITVMFNGVSTNGTASLQIQIGSTTYSTSGYICVGTSGAGLSTSYTTGFGIRQNASISAAIYGAFTISNITGNTWVCSGVVADTSDTRTCWTGGVSPSLSGTLDRVRIIGSSTGTPSDTFDAGSINIMYE